MPCFYSIDDGNWMTEKISVENFNSHIEDLKARAYALRDSL